MEKILEIIFKNNNLKNKTSLTDENFTKKNYKLSVKVVFVFVFLFLLPFTGFSQTKFEKEFRIKKEEVPKIAVSFVDSLNFESKIKWFKEEGLNSSSIEAKTKFMKKDYSIEFSEIGIFQDLEIEITSSEISNNTYSTILGILSEKNKWYKVDKIQLKITGSKNSVLSYLSDNRINKQGVTIEYEIVISTKMNGAFVLKEYTFSETGDYIQSKQIIQRKNSFLDFGT